MQQQLINLNTDLHMLNEDGYEFMVNGGHLIVHHIPYVTSLKRVELGSLVCILTYMTPTKLGPPKDHTIYFIGETPCDSEGTPLTAIINNSQRQQLTQDITVNHYFSSKPITGNYKDYYDKIRTYSEILCCQAKVIDNSVTARPLKTVKHE